jgi:hypothetical protein
MTESKNSVKRVLGWERVPDKKIAQPPKDVDASVQEDSITSHTTFDSFLDAEGNPVSDDGNPMVLPDSYRTLSQNEFLCECIIDGKGISIVHFYDEDSKYYRAVDAVLGTMSKKYPDVRFVRLKGREAPLVSKKLSIIRAPEVLAMKNREVRDRISHFGESEFFSMEDECRMLHQWVTKKITPLGEQD